MLCKQTTGILILILQLIVVVQLQYVVYGDYIPPKLDGFVYEDHSFDFNTDILIEVFYDPLCPYSRDSWPPLKQALHHYGSQISGPDYIVEVNRKGGTLWRIVEGERRRRRDLRQRGRGNGVTERREGRETYLEKRDEGRWGERERGEHGCGQCRERTKG